MSPLNVGPRAVRTGPGVVVIVDAQALAARTGTVGTANVTTLAGAGRGDLVPIAVTDAAGMTEVVAAACRGVNLLVCGADELVHALCDDLRRAGARVVRPGTVEEVRRDPLAILALDPRQTALLRALAQGQSVQDAATSLGLAPRTAARALAGARTALGVTSLAEAVGLWVAAGVDGR